VGRPLPQTSCWHAALSVTYGAILLLSYFSFRYPPIISPRSSWPFSGSAGRSSASTDDCIPFPQLFSSYILVFLISPPSVLFFFPSCTFCSFPVVLFFVSRGQKTPRLANLLRLLISTGMHPTLSSPLGYSVLQGITLRCPPLSLPCLGSSTS